MPSDPPGAPAGGAPLPSLQPVSLPQLQQLGGIRAFQVCQVIAALGDADPVQGWIRIEHHGPVLEVEGEAHTSVERLCDRCLTPFRLPLQARAHERLLLDAANAPGAHRPGALPAPGAAIAWTSPAVPTPGRDALEVGLSGDGPEERLDPQGSFDPEQWLFEQLSLQLPLVNRCGADCPGPDCWSTADPVLDPRWAALRRLHQDGV